MAAVEGSSQVAKPGQDSCTEARQVWSGNMAPQACVPRQPSGRGSQRAKVGGDGLETAVEHAALHLAALPRQRSRGHLQH